MASEQPTENPTASTSEVPERKKPQKEKKAKPPQKEKKKEPSKKMEGAALIGIDVRKEDDLPDWYTQVLTKGSMISYYDVSGCYILEPSAYHIWETIQGWFNSKIKAMGVRNCYFPVFISQANLQREKDHLEGFAAEVAWVTLG
jgi:prolyl-tRNA synthetase